MTTLITGGAGFIGSTLATRLVASGEKVVVLDDLSTGAMENLDDAVGANLEFVLGSILDEALVSKLVADADEVYHLAAAVGVNNIVNDPLGSLRTNLGGTENVLDACLEHDAKVLVASTSEIYGKNDSDLLSEDSDRIYGSPMKCRWSYAEAKALDEMVTEVYVRERGLRAVIARPFNTVGPKQRGRYGMVLPRLVTQAVTDEPLTIYGDGTQSRCFCHVEDMLDGLTAIMAHPDALGRPFNLGGPEEISIRNLAERIIEISGSKSEITYVPYSEAYGPGYEDMRRRVPDTTRARELVGFVVKRTLDDIINSVVDHKRKSLVTDAANAA